MKKLLSIIISLAMLLSITSGLNLTVYADELTSGKCGEDVYWSFDKSSDVLTISGTGSMFNYYSYYHDPWGEYDSENFDYLPWSNFDNNITSVIIEEGVTTIGSGAFYYNNRIETLVIPKSIQQIGEKLLSYYSSYIKIYYNGTINQWCQIDLKSDILNYNNELYIDNELVTDVVIEGITSINGNAFCGYKFLKSVVIKEGIETIGYYSFYCCSNLSNISLPDSLTYVGKRSFYNTGYYNNEDNWDNHALYISNILFYINYSENPYDLVVKDGVFYICDLEYSDSLNSITLPNSINHIPNFNIPIIRYDGNLYNWLKIKDVHTTCEKLYLKGKLLTNADIQGLEEIPEYAFYGLKDLTSVTIGNDVKAINDNAFSNCSSLETVTLGNNVESIGYRAFYDCAKLNNILIPDSVISIGDLAFTYCSDLTSITIGKDVEEIGSEAFSGCNNLVSVTVPNKVTNIKSYTFKDCEKLKEVSISDNITSIGNSAFENCFSISNIILPNALKTIGDSAFKNCSSLSNFDLPEGLESIGIYAFSSCHSLTKVVIPDSVKIVGKYIDNYDPWGEGGSESYYSSGTFADCINLKTVVIGKGINAIYRGMFSGCNKLEEVTIPDSVKIIDNSVFNECSSLKEINIPDDVTYIGEYAFNGCSRLEKINIPSSVETIEKSAFWNCPSLIQIVINNPNCYIYNNYETISGSAKIVGYVGSTAHTYAGNYNRTFIDINSINENDNNADDEEHTHSYTSSITKQPTCSSVGIKTFTCSCGDSYTVDIPKSEHSYTTKTTKATLTKNGSINTSCDVCGNVNSTQIIYAPKSYTLSSTSYTYDGKAKKPTVTVKDSKGNIISKNNYTVTYTNNKNVGKATVKITFKGNYSGTVSKSFTINPKPTKITSLKAKSKGFAVKWNKVTGQVDGYQIQYSESSNFKSAKTVTVKGYKNINKTVNKLKAKKKYYVRVRTYRKVGKVTYYSTWSKTKSVKTVK